MGKKGCVFLKKLIKKKLPKRIIPSKAWFFGVERERIFNPMEFDDVEKYFETLMIWKEREMKTFVERHPRLLIKGHRHKNNSRL